MTWQATVTALVALGCGGRAATTTPAAPPGVSLAGLLGQPLTAPAVAEFTGGASPLESATHDARTWTIVGADFACDLVALRGPVGGELAWRTFQLDCARTAPGERTPTYAGPLPAGLTWASTEHTFRRAAYEATPVRERLYSGGRPEGDFAGRPLPSIDQVTFTYPQAQLFPDGLPPPPPPPTEPATPTEGWWASWLGEARKYGFTERERRFVPIDVPPGTNGGSGHVALTTTPGQRYVVIAWVEYADGGNLALTGTRDEPRPKIGPIANTAVGMVWYGGAVASGSELLVDVAANNASVHTRCSLWLFHAPGTAP